MRISDWSSDVCSSDLGDGPVDVDDLPGLYRLVDRDDFLRDRGGLPWPQPLWLYDQEGSVGLRHLPDHGRRRHPGRDGDQHVRSEEHTSELQSLMRISYAVFCLKKKT